MPPARQMSLSPILICWAAIMTAFMPLAQTLLTRVEGVSTLHPASMITYLSGACPAPAEITWPKNDSWISVGWTPHDSRAPLAAADPSYDAGMFLNWPINPPIGVLLAPTITTDLPLWPNFELKALLVKFSVFMFLLKNFLFKFIYVRKDLIKDSWSKN